MKQNGKREGGEDSRKAKGGRDGRGKEEGEREVGVREGRGRQEGGLARGDVRFCAFQNIFPPKQISTISDLSSLISHF